MPAKPVRDKKYPRSSRAGVLRRTNRGRLVVSTSALHERLTWPVYREFLPTMQHTRIHHGYVTPESCEAFLETLKGNP